MKARLLVVGLLILIVFLLIPGAALGGAPYGYGPYWRIPYAGAEGMPPASTVRHFRVARSADRDNYYVTIYVTGMTPQEVVVSVEGGRWLTVRAEDSREYTYENIAPDRSAFARSFSYSSGSAARRFILPRDANPGAMQRQDDEGLVRVVIPRLQRPDLTP
jgi:HSP20 family molecular chaperone IbpA